MLLSCASDPPPTPDSEANDPFGEEVGTKAFTAIMPAADNIPPVNAVNPQISIYGPSGSTVVANYGMTLQSTGLFYYLFTPTAGAVQGYYQAWFSGELPCRT